MINDEQLRHVILAEDEPFTRMLMSRHLTNAGYAVTACEDGNIALNTVLGQGGGGIVLADWEMPGMDGIALCKAIRELVAEKVIPFVYFIMVTAHSSKEHMVTALEAGADECLAKPYNAQEMLARIRSGVRICTLQRDLLVKQLELTKINGEASRLNRKLQFLANTDTLTGLPNRRAFFGRFESAWELSTRWGRSLSCLMFDVDKFKRINDTFGHAAGDEVLRYIAKRTSGVVRKPDHLGRLGGEEFCIALPETTVEGAISLADRLRLTIASTPVAADGHLIPVRISVGVAQREPRHANVESLLADADAMLYRAKENGRNQVWACEGPNEGRRASAPDDAASPGEAQTCSVPAASLHSTHADPADQR